MVEDTTDNRLVSGVKNLSNYEVHKGPRDMRLPHHRFMDDLAEKANKLLKDGAQKKLQLEVDGNEISLKIHDKRPYNGPLDSIRVKMRIKAEDDDARMYDVTIPHSQKEDGIRRPNRSRPVIVRYRNTGEGERYTTKKVDMSDIYDESDLKKRVPEFAEVQTALYQALEEVDE